MQKFSHLLGDIRRGQLVFAPTDDKRRNLNSGEKITLILPGKNRALLSDKAITTNPKLETVVRGGMSITLMKK